MYYERINGSKMEYSKYNIYIKDYPRIGHTTIYNLFKRQIICVQTTQLKHPALKIEDKLRNGGFLVPSHGDEFTELQQYYDDFAGNQHKWFACICGILAHYDSRN